MFFLKFQFNSNYRKIWWWKLHLYCTIRYIYTTPDVIKGGGDLVVGHITVAKEVCSIQRAIHTVFIEEWSANGIWEDKKSTRRGGLQQWTGRAVVTVGALVAAASRASIGRVGACWPVAMTTGSHNTAPPPPPPLRRRHFNILYYYEWNRWRCNAFYTDGSSRVTAILPGAVVLPGADVTSVTQFTLRPAALRKWVSAIDGKAIDGDVLCIPTCSIYSVRRTLHNREIRLSLIYQCVHMSNSLFSIRFLVVILCIYTTKLNLNKMFLNISTLWPWE